MLISNIAAVLSFTQAGKLRGLAVTGTARSKVAPDLPTIAESGFPGFDVSSWYALLVPAKTPAVYAAIAANR